MTEDKAKIIENSLNELIADAARGGGQHRRPFVKRHSAAQNLGTFIVMIAVALVVINQI